MLARKLASEGVSVVYAVLCCVVCVCVQEVPLKSRDCHAANGENPASSSG